MTQRTGAVALGLGAALLFGASIPLTKLLVADAGPLALASLLYLGAGFALTVLRPLRRTAGPPLSKSDAPWLAGIVAAGAIAGPALLVVGLRRLPGLPAALLLNLEAPLTALLAVVLFGEYLGPRGWLAAGVMTAGATLLAVRPGALPLDLSGALAVALACGAWAVDTNLTQRLSAKDPVALVRFKGLAGGSGTLVLALVAGEHLPSLRTSLAALVLGAFGYGASIVWHVRALRQIGAARQSAVFAAAPFFGALLSVLLLGEGAGVREAVAALLMAIGIVLLSREKHSHRHVHGAVEHEHWHAHDEMHQHHPAGQALEPHSHLHRHERIEHEHEHGFDPKHRHKH
jgi:drug/metabolite transporter (DMT)-like permease